MVFTDDSSFLFPLRLQSSCDIRQKQERHNDAAHTQQRATRRSHGYQTLSCWTLNRVGRRSRQLSCSPSSAWWYRSTADLPLAPLLRGIRNGSIDYSLLERSEGPSLSPTHSTRCGSALQASAGCHSGLRNDDAGAGSACPALQRCFRGTTCARRHAHNPLGDARCASHVGHPGLRIVNANCASASGFPCPLPWNPSAMPGSTALKCSPPFCSLSARDKYFGLPFPSFSHRGHSWAPLAAPQRALASAPDAQSFQCLAEVSTWRSP